NPCYQRICQNGGTCSVIANATNVSFTCTCSNSYAGQYCETSLDALANRGCLSECMNGGSCIK
ncbi:unnamed protein product, partial [Rotaria magnacalcarata]